MILELEALVHALVKVLLKAMVALLLTLLLEPLTPPSPLPTFSSLIDSFFFSPSFPSTAFFINRIIET